MVKRASRKERRRAMRGTATFLMLCIVLSIGLFGAEAPEESGYAFQLDGREVYPRLYSLGGEAGGPREGDVVRLHYPDYWFVLGKPGEYSLRIDKERGLLLRVLGDESEEPLAAIVGKRFAKQGEPALNPLAALSAKEIEGLRGISLKQWPEGLEASLQMADLERVCLVVSEGTAMGPKRVMPSLPEKARYLAVVMQSSEGVKDYGPLKALAGLRFLYMDTLRFDPLDTSLFSGMKDLRYFSLTGEEIENPTALSALTGLRVLDLSWTKGFTDIEFVRGMAELRVLLVGVTPVEDLTPLEGLAHLRHVNADPGRVKTLPRTAMPTLEKLDVVMSQVSEEEARRFLEKNPQCELRRGYNATVRKAMEGVDRLEIWPVVAVYEEGHEKEPEALIRVEDAEEVWKVAGKIVIDEEKSGFHCMCIGTLVFRFFKGDELKTVLTYHHGVSFRWGGWPADGALTAESADFLNHWLAGRGVEGPLKEVERTKARRRDSQQHLDRASKGLPSPVAEALGKDQKALTAALEAAFPDPVDRAVALFHIYGAWNGPWRMAAYFDTYVPPILKKEPVEVLQKAVSRALAGGDRLARRGAVRYWTGWRSPLEEWMPEESEVLCGTALEAMQEAACAQIRRTACIMLTHWAGELPEVVVDARLGRLLHDPDPDVRKEAMMVAGSLRRAEFTEELMGVIGGRSLEVADLPPIPPEEAEISVDGRCSPTRSTLSEAETAALALGFLEYEPAREALVKEVDPPPGFQVALALLGETDRLEAEHFQGDFMEAADLRNAALAVVLRSKGRAGLKLAIDSYGEGMPKWRQEEDIRRLAQLLKKEGASGVELLEAAKTIEDLRAWYAEHGEAFVSGAERTADSSEMDD